MLDEEKVEEWVRIEVYPLVDDDDEDDGAPSTRNKALKRFKVIEEGRQSLKANGICHLSSFFSYHGLEVLVQEARDAVAAGYAYQCRKEHDVLLQTRPPPSSSTSSSSPPTTTDLEDNGGEGASQQSQSTAHSTYTDPKSIDTCSHSTLPCTAVADSNSCSSSRYGQTIVSSVAQDHLRSGRFTRLHAWPPLIRLIEDILELGDGKGNSSGRDDPSPPPSMSPSSRPEDCKDHNKNQNHSSSSSLTFMPAADDDKEQKDQEDNSKRRKVHSSPSCGKGNGEEGQTLPTLYPLADPLGGATINVFHPGDKEAEEEGSGQFEYLPPVKGEAAKSRFSRAAGREGEKKKEDRGEGGAKDENRLVEEVEKMMAEAGGPRTLDFHAGDLIIFMGSQCLHRVLEVKGKLPRLTAVLCYADRPDVMNSEEVRKCFWGRSC